MQLPTLPSSSIANKRNLANKNIFNRNISPTSTELLHKNCTDNQKYTKQGSCGTEHQASMQLENAHPIRILVIDGKKGFQSSFRVLLTEVNYSWAKRFEQVQNLEKWWCTRYMKTIRQTTPLRNIPLKKSRKNWTKILMGSMKCFQAPRW